MTNIKDMGKQLLGGSLNNFHRKVGLESIEKNNEMQTKVLQGIYSQVDNNYVEKTEESNVIHLDGSGDGVVEVVSVEGNTMVNLVGGVFNNTTYYTKNSNGSINVIRHNTVLPPFIGDSSPDLKLIKPNTRYTLIVEGDCSNLTVMLRDYVGDTPTNHTNIYNGSINDGKLVFSTLSNKTYIKLLARDGVSYPINNLFITILEGDWTNRELPPHFEGLQSSFEEKQVDDKYEIEILLNNKNLISFDNVETNASTLTIKEKTSSSIIMDSTNTATWRSAFINNVKVKPNTTIVASYDYSVISGSPYRGILLYNSDNGALIDKDSYGEDKWTIPSNVNSVNVRFCASGDTVQVGVNKYSNVQLEYGDKPTIFKEPKHNKIKVSIKEPLRGIGDTKDRLCIVDGRLVVERNCDKLILNGQQYLQTYPTWDTDNTMAIFGNYTYFNNINYKPAPVGYSTCISDKFVSAKYSDFNTHKDIEKTIMYGHNEDNQCCSVQISINRNKLETQTIESVNKWLRDNNQEFIYQLAETYYEEVLNEYGEPILLEGYENGTLYIDSVIVPKTTVKYTPKMESYKEIHNIRNNISKTTTYSNNNSTEAIVLKMLDLEGKIYELELKHGIEVNEEKRKQDNYNLLVNNLNTDLMTNGISVGSFVDPKLDDNANMELIKLVKELAIKNI